MDKNETSQVETNCTTSEFELRQGKRLIAMNYLQNEIKFLREEIGDKNEIIKTLVENINCLEKNNRNY